MKRTDIKKILIIGSGPIVIGQACEFDYSGTQACKALKELGYKIVLVNSNPATIMTDPVMADVTYIEPLNIERVSQIIEKEQPDALLPNLGGQTGLNLAIELSEQGILEKYGVEVIGVNLEAIKKGEDRELFKDTMNKLGIATPKSEICNSVSEAEEAAKRIGFPLCVRPAFTMGGQGGGFCYNFEELKTIAEHGLNQSIAHQVLVEQSILGWEELEVEVVRDSKNQMIAICFIENIDPVGVHTGDSFCAAPFLTIDKALEKRLQEMAFKIVEEIGVIGGTNVQFAHNPKTDEVVIIEINPRTSRSSALASKATGFPIALVSAKLACGMTLDELPYWNDKNLAKYVPTGDYTVLKFPRFAFEKFKNAENRLGTSMKSVGEVMSIGKSFEDAFQKSIRGLESKASGLGNYKNYRELPFEELLGRVSIPNSDTYFQIYELLRKGASVNQVSEVSRIKVDFIQKMADLVKFETEKLETVTLNTVSWPVLTAAKELGFSDKYLSKIWKCTEKEVRDLRTSGGIVERWYKIPVSGVENKEYYYSSYIKRNSNDLAPEPSKNKKKIMILGGGPNRIGQGIEFDYCCCHAAMQLKEMGYETIIVNCNPETVSTDYDTSDKLYFEPITVEDVLQIYNHEKPMGVIVQFGGQTPLNIARELQENGVNILGTSIDSIDKAEDREEFRQLMTELNIPMPESEMAHDLETAKKAAEKIGYPVMIRPSFVLGGRGMEIIYNEEMLERYVGEAIGVTPETPLLIDRFLHNALECECDSLASNGKAFVPAVMEHVELAGIHSGDSACIIPSISISESNLETIKEYASAISKALNVTGLLNIQFAIENGKVYVIEANPRASRTVPLVSKVCNIQMARLATELMLGADIDEIASKNTKKIPYFGVKEAILPWNRFPEVEPALGPEMRSTGEVLGMNDRPDLAYLKAQEAAKMKLPRAPQPWQDKKILVSITEKDRNGHSLYFLTLLHKLGFRFDATENTAKWLRENGFKCTIVPKLKGVRPNVGDNIMNGRYCMVINTLNVLKAQSRNDIVSIRKVCLKYSIPYITTVEAAGIAAKGIVDDEFYIKGIKSLQDYHKMI